jgi:hypothetical protein
MTYEEALAEIEYRIKELGGIGAHTTPKRAKRAYETATGALAKLEEAVATIRKEIKEGGYERYLTQ